MPNQLSLIQFLDLVCLLFKSLYISLPYTSTYTATTQPLLMSTDCGFAAHFLSANYLVLPCVGAVLLFAGYRHGCMLHAI
jgi:hypothetical protein